MAGDRADSHASGQCAPPGASHEDLEGVESRMGNEPVARQQQQPRLHRCDHRR